MTVTLVPYWASIRHGGDDYCVVYLVPVEKVEPSYRVAEDAEAPDCGAGSCHYRFNVV